MWQDEDRPTRFSDIPLDDVIDKIPSLKNISNKEEKELHAAMILDWLVCYTNGFPANVGQTPNNKKLMNRDVAIYVFENNTLPNQLSKWLLDKMGKIAQQNALADAEETFKFFKNRENDKLIHEEKFHLGRFGHTLLPTTPRGSRIRNFSYTEIIDKFDTHGHFFFSTNEWVCYGAVPQETDFIKGFYHILRDPYFPGFYPAFGVKKRKSKDEVKAEGQIMAQKAEAEGYFTPVKRDGAWFCTYWCPIDQEIIQLVSEKEPSHILGMSVDTIKGLTLLNRYKKRLSGDKHKRMLRHLLHAASTLPITQ